MQLRKKYYPYPVLVEEGDCYTNSSFSTTLSQTMDGYNIKLSFRTTIINDLLSNMVENGDISILYHIECPQTCYRNIFSTKDTDYELLLQDKEVNGIVQVCSFLVANHDINNYTNEAFSSDYRGWKFNIEKGCIMAVGGQYTLRINKSKDDLSDTSSIFSIIRSVDPIESIMRVDLNNQKITVILPWKTHSQYNSIKDYLDLQPVLHSMIIIPALVYTFSTLKESGEQIFEYESKRWFIALKKACKNMEIDLDSEGIQNIDPLVISQKLINSPIVNGIEYFTLGGSAYED